MKRKEFSVGLIPGLVQSHLRKTVIIKRFVYGHLQGGEYTQGFEMSGLAIRRRPGVVFRMEHSIGGAMGRATILSLPRQNQSPIE
jgi:hypothetical protein